MPNDIRPNAIRRMATDLPTREFIPRPFPLDGNVHAPS